MITGKERTPAVNPFARGHRPGFNLECVHAVRDRPRTLCELTKCLRLNYTSAPQILSKVPFKELTLVPLQAGHPSPLLLLDPQMLTWQILLRGRGLVECRRFQIAQQKALIPHCLPAQQGCPGQEEQKPGQLLEQCGPCQEAGKSHGGN